MRTFGIRPLTAALLGLTLSSAAHGQTYLYTNLTNVQESGEITPTLTTGAPPPVSYGKALFTMAADQSFLFIEAMVDDTHFDTFQTEDANDRLVRLASGEIRSVISSVPEPATLLLFGSGLVALRALRRKRPRNRAG